MLDLRTLVMRHDSFNKRVQAFFSQFKPESLFVTESHRIFTSQSVAAKAYREDTTTVTKSGYYPLCISSCNSNTRYAVFYSSYLSNQAVGSVDIHTGLCNADPSSSHSFTLSVHVLWMKAGVLPF